MHREGMAHAAGKAADDQITPYHLTQARPATFIAQAEAAAGANLPQFVKDEFGVPLECGTPGLWRPEMTPGATRA
jgi:hypothetical protein